MTPDLACKIIAYELGEMDTDEQLTFFQNLVNTGLAWTLPGRYGRAAAALVDSGQISPPPENCGETTDF